VKRRSTQRISLSLIKVSVRSDMANSLKLLNGGNFLPQGL
jgi:hypothetical protein